MSAATVAGRDASTGLSIATSVRSPWRRGHYVLITAFALCLALVHAEVPTNTDPYWNARAGDYFLDTGHLLRVDTWSWTAEGHAWTPNSWGWNVVLALAYRAMGVVGFWVVGAVLSLLLAGVVVVAAQRLGARPMPTIAVYVPIAMFGTVAVPRAETLSTIVIPLIPLLVLPAVTGDRRSSARAMGLLAVVELTWVNMHSAALIGPVIVGVSSLAILAAHRTAPTWRRWCGRSVAATVVTAACTLVTPFGTALWTHAMDVRRASSGLISEWEPVGFHDVTSRVGLLLVVLTPAVAWRVWRAGRPEVASALLLLAAASATAIRFLPMLVVLAAAEVALLLSRAQVRTGIFKIIVGFMALVLAALVVRDAGDIRSPGKIVSPKLMDAIPHGCRLLNDDVVGSAVILFRPDVKVSLDGRNDMYGRAGLLKVLHMFDDRPGTAVALDEDRVGCILGPSHTHLVERLSVDPRWRVVGHDIVRTLLVRAAP